MASITDAVAVVRDQRQNLVAFNDLGRAFYSPLIGDGGRMPNFARFQFLDPVSHDFYPDWERFADMCVAVIRAEAGRDPESIPITLVAVGPPKRPRLDTYAELGVERLVVMPPTMNRHAPDATLRWLDEWAPIMSDMA